MLQNEVILSICELSHFRGGKFILKKTFYGVTREVPITTQMWSLIQASFEKIERASLTGQKILESLDDTYSLISSVWTEGDGKRYTGVQVIDQDGMIQTDQGINLTEGEWRSLASNAEHVENVMEGNHVKKGVKRSLGEKLLMWRWVLEYAAEGEHIDLPVCEYPFYTERDARMKGRSVVLDILQGSKTCKGEQILVKTESFLGTPPDMNGLVKLCAFFMLQLYFSILGREVCKGCRTSPGVKTVHDRCASKGGCRDEKRYKSRLETGKRLLTTGDVEVVASAVCRALGIIPDSVGALSTAVFGWVDDSLWVQRMKEYSEGVPDEDKPLHAVITRVLDELNLETEIQTRMYFPREGKESIFPKEDILKDDKESVETVIVEDETDE